MKKGQNVEIEHLGPPFANLILGTVLDVGEGIVLINQGMVDNDVAISSCAITRVVPNVYKLNITKAEIHYFLFCNSA
ncbi:hypothetical protein [Chengkuizengella sediminis]|uniref:hypothetical protein n=1 Tax=Chengkuizengella sediminis TaxID=1885917 RepID=UPI0013899778|nr:hypothetical protein [Chengkuizengella sediminis]NDI35600.1 hypothetical protein [Chengkuizengella sediminis]